MAYTQWIMVQILNYLATSDIKVQAANLSWGKFYHCSGSKDDEKSSHDVDNTVIPPGKAGKVCSCGRESAASGTQGSFQLRDGETTICTIYWECPWGSGANTVEIRDYNMTASPYNVFLAEWNKSDGAIGNVFVIISAK